MHSQKTCAVCFVSVLILGASFVAVGLLLMPVLPYFQLDAVLSPEDLANPQVHDATLAMLRKAGGNQWLLWTLAGAMLCVVGGIGLRASLRIGTRPKVHPTTNENGNRSTD
jgi:hypothetical protein